MQLMNITDFPTKDGNEKKTQAWKELETQIDYLINHPDQVFLFSLTHEELETLFRRYSDPLQAVYRALKRNPKLQHKRLGVRSVTKERKRGERPAIELIGISRGFWEE